MKNFKTNVFVLFCLVSLILCRQTVAEETPSADLTRESVIERVYIDRSSSHDPGTIVVVLKNKTAKVLRIGDIEVNGVTVKKWPFASDPILWHRISHSVLEPQQSGLILLKLAQYSSGMIRLEVDIDDEPQITLLSTSNSETVRIEAIRYDPDGRRVNVFVTNKGRAVEKLKYIELNGRKVWSPANGELAVVPDMTEVAHVVLDNSLKAGQIVLLRIHLEDRVLGARDRAIPGFRISIESGDQEMAKRIHADPVVLDSFQFREEKTSDGELEAAPSLVERQGSRWSLVHVSHGVHVSKKESDLACVFACPTHATDSYHTSAYLAMMAQEEVEKRPSWQSFIHTCRSQPLRGLAMFGQIADCVRFNGQLKTSISASNSDRDEVPWTVYQFVRYAVSSAAPSLTIPMIPVEKDRALFPRRAPLALEARQMAYAALSAGTGGLAYRIMEKDWGKESRDAMIDEVTRVNNEIRQIRDYLAMGFPRQIARCSDPKVQVSCLDAMPKGMIVILINHDLRRSPPEMQPSIEAKKRENVEVSISMPDGFTHAVVREIYDTKSTELDSVEFEGNELKILIPSMGATKLLLIEPKDV